MSRIRADKFVNNAANGAPQLTYGVEVIAGVGLTGAGGINITGIATAASFSGNATGLTGTPNIDCGTGSFTGDVDIADKIIHTGDTNTAIRFPAADTFTVETAGVERLRVNSGGVLLGLSAGVGEGGTPADLNSTEVGRGFINIARDDTAAADHILFGKNGAIASSIGTDTTNTLVFKTGTTERLRITSAGEVRIGDNSTTASTAGDDLVIEGSSDRGISIISGTSSSGNVYFGDSGDTDIGRIAYQHNDNAFQFYTSATKRVQVDSDGLKFNSDTAAANALDDYEEGNGTPSVTFQTSGTATLGAGPTFKYVKIGDLVTFSFEFQLSAVSNPVGGVQLALPFASGAGVYSAGAVRLYNVTFTGSPFLEIGPSSSSVVVLGSVSGAANSQINGTGYYFGTISYRTSS